MTITSFAKICIEILGTGKPFTIHTSIDTVNLLREHDGLYKIVERNGKVTLKNRGQHQTYFLVGKSELIFTANYLI